MTVPVVWQDLLDAHQGITPDDPALHPHLCLDTGAVTCPALADERAELIAIPVKGAAGSWAQRHAFAETLCDDELRAEVLSALATPEPFAAFDAALAWVPVEAARWLEQERISDLACLLDWFRRSGVEPTPLPHLERSILEFPRRP